MYEYLLLAVNGPFLRYYSKIVDITPYSQMKEKTIKAPWKTDSNSIVATFRSFIFCEVLVRIF